MSRRNELDAIVVGAGAIGASLALALARDGFEVALVEAREPKPWRVDDEVDLRVVALAPDARELLGSLDVWTSISEARANAYRRMHVWDALGPGQLNFDAADNGDAALGWIVENKLIQHALWSALNSDVARTSPSPTSLGEEAGVRGRGFSDARRWHSSESPPPHPTPSPKRSLEERATVRLYCPAEIVDLDNAADAVTATLTDGTRLRARILVAAEGAESSLRTKLGIAFSGRDYHQRAIVAHVGTERPHEHTAWQRFMPGGPLAFLPLDDGRCSIVWSLPDAEAARILALDDEAFRAELGCAFDFRLGAITATSARAAFPLRMRLAERYVAGRCVLIGDAAHVVHPLAGQGMNLGFRDISCLRRAFAYAREHGGDLGAAHVLRRYERVRRSENLIAAYVLDGLQRLSDSNNPLLAASRGIAIAAVERFVPAKKLFADIAAGRR